MNLYYGKQTNFKKKTETLLEESKNADVIRLNIASANLRKVLLIYSCRYLHDQNKVKENSNLVHIFTKLFRKIVDNIYIIANVTFSRFFGN